MKLNNISQIETCSKNYMKKYELHNKKILVINCFDDAMFLTKDNTVVYITNNIDLWREYLKYINTTKFGSADEGFYKDTDMDIYRFLTECAGYCVNEFDYVVQSNSINKIK